MTTPSPAPPTTPEQLVVDVTGQLAQLDPYAKEPLSGLLVEIVGAFQRAGRRDLRCEVADHVAELGLSFHFDVIDPYGKVFPEMRLSFRRRSRSAIARGVRSAFGSIPRARVLVLTPRGYRMTMPRFLDAKRFLVTGRPRLAPYRLASIVNLSGYLIDTFGAALRGRRLDPA